MSAQLYRHFDAADTLLYVGISLSAITRLRQHGEASSWFSEIASVHIENFLTREEALAAERTAIKAERPKFNIKHNKPEKPEKVRKPTLLDRLTDTKNTMVWELTTLKPVYDLYDAAKVLDISGLSLRRLITERKIGFIEIPKPRAAGFDIRITGWQILEYLEASMEHHA